MIIPLLTLSHTGHSDPNGKEFGDHKLEVIGYYDNLPWIGVMRPLYTMYFDGPNTTVCTYSDMIVGATDEESDVIRNALEFEQYSVYINLSRVSLHRTYLRHQVLMARGTDDYAVGISVGVVQESDLNSDADNVEGCNYITITPIWHNIRRETAYWATKYGATDLHLPIEAKGIRYSSMGVYEKPPTSGPPGLLHVFASVLPSTEEVPIYDGRPETEAFNCTSADFSRLESWPRYPELDPPESSAVIVGYSVTAAGGAWPLKRHVALNIQFVIVLAD